MKLMRHLRLRTKLAVLLGLSVLAVLACAVTAASLMHQRMIDDRVDKLRAVVQTTIGIARAQEAQVAAQKLTREQAIEHLRADIHGMRFDAGDGYVIMRRGATILLHGADPKLEDKPSATKDADGRLLADLIEDALRGRDEGVVSYLFPKPGRTQPVPKLSYVAPFAPWQVVFFAGAYVDDLETAFNAVLMKLATMGAVVVLLTLAAAWLIERDIVLSLDGLKAAMERLAGGDLSTPIPGTDRRDEVGAMAKVVLVFRDHMVKEARLAGEQVSEHQAAAEKRQALLTMANTIEQESGVALDAVAGRTTEIVADAQEMTASAERTGGAAQGAASAAAQALANAQTVASAAEQLATSIREIATHVDQSGAKVSEAVAAGNEARSTMEALNERVGQIGAVADMIGDIAAKTNLLALNATIEAARAGEAGKGFAVVASEVKQLANQTARSTNEIGRHLADVRTATGASVATVQRIEQTIGEVSAIANMIAASVEEQGAATSEIARSVNETAAAANEMTRRIEEVSAEAVQTGGRCSRVRDGTAALNEMVAELRRSVIRAVRGSTDDADRRQFVRVAVDLPCRLTVPGTGMCAARVFDLSRMGARVSGGPILSAGARGTVDIDRIGMPLQFSVRAVDGPVLHLAFELDEAGGTRLAAMLETLGRASAA